MIKTAKKLVELGMSATMADVLVITTSDSNMILELIFSNSIDKEFIDQVYESYTRNIEASTVGVLYSDLPEGIRTMGLAAHVGYELVVKGYIVLESAMEVTSDIIDLLISTHVVKFGKVTKLKRYELLTPRGTEALNYLITEKLDDSYIVPVRTLYIPDEINELSLEAKRHISRNEPTGTPSVAVVPEESKEIVDAILKRIMSK